MELSPGLPRFGGYPGIKLSKEHNPSGVASPAQIERRGEAATYPRDCHNPVGVAINRSVTKFVGQNLPSSQRVVAEIQQASGRSRHLTVTQREINATDIDATAANLEDDRVLARGVSL